MQTRKTSMRRTFPIAVALIGCCIAPALAAPAETKLATASGRELWRKGSDQILAGDFASAARTLERIRDIEPRNSGVRSALTWLHEAQQLADSRERFRSRVYNFWVKKAVEAAEEAKHGKSADGSDDKAANGEGKTENADGVSKSDNTEEEEDDERYKWSRALLYAQRAMANAKDEDAFRAEPWLADIVENAEHEIERHKAASEWRDAAALYGMLRRLYPDDDDYEEGYKVCRKWAHLKFIYGKKSTWRTDLADVGPEAVSEILRRISEDYVEGPDYRELCRSGLESLLLLARAETLSERFPTLAEEDLVARFTNRLKGLIKRKVDGKRTFKAGTVRSVFRSLRSANRDTLRLPEPVLVDEFVAGMLEHLDDFTSVIWPSEVTEFNKQTRGEFVGVGIQITQESGKPVRVETPLEDSPAYRAGVKPGDLITHVNGKSTIDMTINEAVRAITGEAGSIVQLTIKDSTTDTSRKIDLKRQKIIIRTVRGHTRDRTEPTGWNYFIDTDLKIAYVRVSGFMDKTVPDLHDALDQMISEDCRGLILDLRFNPGGLLTSAVNMCDLFLDEDSPIVQTKGRSRHQNMTIRARRKEAFGDLPMIVMVNEYSASASEIVAGALAGLKEACIVGSRSFGKGSVQNLIPIIDSQAYLKLTTAHYYVPDSDLLGDDQWYLLHRKRGAKTWGVEPHITVDLIPREINKVLRLRRERDVLKGKGQNEVPKEILERRASSTQEENYPEDEDPDTDPQLVVALDVMRIKLMSNQPWALAPRLERTVTVAEIPGKVKPETKQR